MSVSIVPVRTTAKTIRESKLGVGFYSGFMVSDKVDIHSKTAGRISKDNDSITESPDDDDDAIICESTGSIKYSISPFSSDNCQD